MNITIQQMIDTNVSSRDLYNCHIHYCRYRFGEVITQSEMIETTCAAMWLDELRLKGLITSATKRIIHQRVCNHYEGKFWIDSTDIPDIARIFVQNTRTSDYNHEWYSNAIEWLVNTRDKVVYLDKHDDLQRTLIRMGFAQCGGDETPWRKFCVKNNLDHKDSPVIVANVTTDTGIEMWEHLVSIGYANCNTSSVVKDNDVTVLYSKSGDPFRPIIDTKLKSIRGL